MRGGRAPARGARHGISHVLQAQTAGGKCSNISRKRQQHAEAACSASRHGRTATNIMLQTSCAQRYTNIAASKPQSERNITHARTEPNFISQRPSGANSRVERGHPLSLATACRKQAARVAAARSLASEWAPEGRGVDRARWLGVEKVRRVHKECGVELTGSGGRGHGGLTSS
jgi:hypothetical protein